MSNYSDRDITTPAKTIISQLSLGNKVPKMIYAGDDKDSELLDKDEGLKYEHFEQHKLISEEFNLEPEEYVPKSCDKSHAVEVEYLGPDIEEDMGLRIHTLNVTNQILESLINQLPLKRMMDPGF